MEWKEYAPEIKEVLELEGSPVAITYSQEPAPDSAGGRHRVCEALLRARDGDVIDLTAENSACPGGTWHLGLGEAPKGEAGKALQEFLVYGEKLFCSYAAFHRAMELTTAPPLGLADHVVFSPLETAEFCPDIVLFICNAEQACRLVTLDGYDTGVPPRVEMAGSTCHMAVAYPVVTGELNVTLMDYTSRRIKGCKASDLIVSIPYHRFHGVMRSIPHCTAGTAKMEIPESFRRLAGESALRLIEVFLPKDYASEAREILEEQPVQGVWEDRISGNHVLLRVLAQVRESERVLDTLEKRFCSLEGFRMVLLPVEAALFFETLSPFHH
ncbi:MAG: hypothetical protein B1H03_04420 [Planctomycetales bacterium 4484_113]|nr:MAG: hypothetical protein B1H03_04420 [Planctomycetales bacterium 4484_113]